MTYIKIHMYFTTVKLNKKEGIERVIDETNNKYYEIPLTNV